MTTETEKILNEIQKTYFQNPIVIKNIYSTKEYSYDDCEVIDVVYLNFMYSGSDFVLKEQTIKLNKAGPVILLTQFNNIQVKIEDLTNLKFESMKYKLVLSDGIEFKTEIICESIEICSPETDSYELCSEDNITINQLVKTRKYIKAYKIVYDLTQKSNELSIELTNDEYMLDKDLYILSFKDFEIEKASYIGLMHELEFEIIVNADEKFQNTFIGAFDDMINDIEIYFNSCKLFE